MAKIAIDKSVLGSARDRISWCFDEFEKVSVAFSGGKDSTVLLYLALEEAERRQQKVDVVFIDLEAQYTATIEFVHRLMALDFVKPHWLCLPLNLRNAVSQFEPFWCCWDREFPGRWVRDLPVGAPGLITEGIAPDWFEPGIEFEELVPKFQEHLANGKSTAVLVGVRSDESLNRYKAVGKSQKKKAYKGIPWSGKVNRSDYCTTFYPLYDWHVTDIWRFHAETDLPYNRLYDQMHAAGISLAAQRICQPYGDDQRQGLDLFHKIEPSTWERVLARVAGANFGNKYAGKKILGNKGSESLPEGFKTWKAYASYLLETLPNQSFREAYERRIDVFLNWWADNGYQRGDVPDEGEPKLEAKKQQPSWRRIAKSIFKMDMGKSLSFGQAKIDNSKFLRERYRDL